MPQRRQLLRPGAGRNAKPLGRRADQILSGPQWLHRPGTSRHRPPPPPPPPRTTPQMRTTPTAATAGSATQPAIARTSTSGCVECITNCCVFFFSLSILRSACKLNLGVSKLDLITTRELSVFLSSQNITHTLHTHTHTRCGMPIALPPPKLHLPPLHPWPPRFQVCPPSPSLYAGPRRSGPSCRCTCTTATARSSLLADTGTRRRDTADSPGEEVLAPLDEGRRVQDHRRVALRLLEVG